MTREEAIKKIKAWDFLNDDEKEVIETLIPELAESEDERIRKELITHCRNTRCVTEEGAEGIAKWIAWLEKQGEQKPQGKSAMEAIKEEKVDNANKVEPKDYSSIDPHFFKATDKVEPKFKVGDWIISDETHEDYRICKITNVENGNYTIESIYGYKGYNTFETFEKSYHLWTIKDAKDGDVLVDVYENTGIFQKNDDFDWTSYCFLGSNKGFQNFNVEHESENAHPATKEQRDLLFSKMKEAGYEWDAEKLEPIKVPKPKEPEGALKKLLDEQDKFYKEAKIVLEDKDTALAFLRITGIIDEYGELAEKYRSVQTLATTVTAWSEEDEKMIEAALQFAHEYGRHGLWCWLKSLKERYTWKPSDEQIKVCKEVYADILSAKGFGLDTVNSEINRLEEQLKKLREV